ncbi:2971_t:CDS:2, partial [Funneliformis caledonium]
GRAMCSDPVIAGLRLPPKDAFVKSLKKEIVGKMVCCIADKIHDYDISGTVKLIAGDGDYRSVISLALKRSWITENWFWS